MRKMRGAIIVPTFYKGRHAKGLKSMVSKTLFDRIEKICNFPFVYTDTPDLRELDVALIYAVPYHNRPKIPSGLLDSNTKLISYFGDLQCYQNRECEENKIKMFDRCSIIIGGFYEKFREWYPQYIHKYELFSGFYHPYENYKSLQINLKPKMKCLLSGTVNRYYPFREYINKLYQEDTEGISKLIDIKKRSFAPFREYPKFLNSYFCAIATSGMYSGVVSKYFEIPAAGTLLLAEEVMELKMLGMEPDIHYVSITRKNVLDKIQYVLSNSDRFLEMRIRAMNFVRKNHSDINRAFQFKSILERLIGNNLDV